MGSSVRRGVACDECRANANLGGAADAGVESNPTLARVARVDAAFMRPMLQCVNDVDAPIDAATGVN
jgi:hypothetical protein